MAAIRHRVGIAAPQTRVYEALATKEGIAGWWSRDVEGDLHAGGTLLVLLRLARAERRDGSRGTCPVRLRGLALRRWTRGVGGHDFTFDLKATRSRPWSCSATLIGASRSNSCSTAARDGGASPRTQARASKAARGPPIQTI